MNAESYFVLFIIGIWIVAALWYMKKGGCCGGGGCKNCQNAGSCGNKKKSFRKKEKQDV
ncbi:MAG: hypothetical protein PUB10_01110 [Clostridiales bacterium]|nr:hypothetical protein [Clostridiales bacterium]